MKRWLELIQLHNRYWSFNAVSYLIVDLEAEKAYLILIAMQHQKDS